MYPTHFFIALTTGLIFLIILVAKAMYAGKAEATPAVITRTISDFLNSQSSGNSPSQIGPGDLITLAGAIITLIIFITTPLISQSLLDYQVKSINSTHIAVDILNSGIKEAKNVLISFNSKGINLTDFTTQPYLPINSFKASKIVQHGNANFSLDSLPSRSFTTVYAKAETVPHLTENLKVYLRTDDSVAYFNLIGIILFYVILSVAYELCAYFFWFQPKHRTLIPPP